MSKILIIGAGAMGSAFSFPCVDNGTRSKYNRITIRDKIINEIQKNNFHPNLNCNLSSKINFLKADKLKEQLTK